MASTLTFAMESSFSPLVSRKLPQTPKPALLMKISSRSSASASQRRAHSLSCSRSAGRMRQKVLYLMVSSAASASSRSVRRAVRMSRKPRRAYRRANSRPMPEDAPVIHTVLDMVPPYSAKPEARSMASSSSSGKRVLLRAAVSPKWWGRVEQRAEDAACTWRGLPFFYFTPL